MAMGPEREGSSPSSSKPPFHNFNFPFGLRWGNQKFLRCMKVNSNGEISAVQRPRRPPPPSSSSAFSNASNGNQNLNVSSIIGKRKERAKLDDVDIFPADYRPGSDFNQVCLDSNAPANTECGRKIKSVESGGDGENGDGIAEMREKLMFDLQTAADKMKDAILRDNDNLPVSEPEPATEVVTVAASETGEGGVCPWNLRTRRAAGKVPTWNGFSSGGGSSPVKGLKVDLVKPNSGLSQLRTVAENNNKSSPRLRSGGAATATAAAGLQSSEKKERVKFSVALLRQEIEEDFLAMTGRRPPRRPQKRPKYIQKNLDTLFPGLWLTEITADMYKVPETQ